jgi:hypothetical protein
VTFVEHDVPEPGEPARVEHVAKDLGRHDEHARAGVDLDVAGEDTDGVGAIGSREVCELLVGERLQRRGVRDALALLERALDGELRDERLPCSRRRRDDDRLARAASSWKSSRGKGNRARNRSSESIDSRYHA